MPSKQPMEAIYNMNLEIRVQFCMTLCMLFILPEPLFPLLENGDKRIHSGTCEG